MDERLRHVLVVGQQLFGILGQAISPVAEAGIVVVVADSGVEAHAINDLLGIEPMGGGVGVELIKVGHAHG